MTEPILDRELIDELLAECGAALVAELAASLAEEGGEGLARLRAAAVAGDHAGAAACLHALRGAALAVGCAALGGETRRLELAAGRGRAPSAAQIDGLGARLAEALDALAGLVGAGR